MYTPENNLEAIATYEAGIFMIEQWMKKYDKRSPLDKMIDEATGYDKEQKQELIPILEDMRDALIFLGEDKKAKETEELLNKLK